MGETTKIEWADATFNPWIGCTKVSPACDSCYAETLATTRMGVGWGPGADRRRTKPGNWAQPERWNRKAAADGTRPFVFTASLADVFDNEVDPRWRADLLDLIDRTPHLVWLLLTKRIGNAVKMVGEAGRERLPANAALGATMVTQEEYDRDSPKLRIARALLDPIFTFGSFEPLLGPMRLDCGAPDWIIVGGESGKAARPMHPHWVADLLYDANCLDRVFNFKQWGEWSPDAGPSWLDTGPAAQTAEVVMVHYDAKNSAAPHRMERIGKKRAGHLFRGAEYLGRPEVAPVRMAVA